MCSVNEQVRTDRGSLAYSSAYHAEKIAVGIFQDHEVTVGSISPRVARGPQRQESLHLALAVVRVEIQVQPTALARAFF